MKLTRRYKFSAAHRLHSPLLDADANRDAYGKCDNPYGHGHNYVLEVTVSGPVDGDGRVVDVGALDEYVSKRVIAPLDHRNMNAEIPEFQGALVPTTENLATVVERRLTSEWPGDGPALSRIRIFETRNNTFEIGIA